MNTFDPLTVSAKRGVGTGDGDGDGVEPPAAASAAKRRTANTLRLHFRRRLADQGSPKAKGLARALSLIRAKRIVVESLL
jgi:hypothetical protein